MSIFKSKLGQYINIEGVTTFIATFASSRSRRSYIPHVRAESVAHINYQSLNELGIKYIVFDKDNTLTAPYIREYFSEMLEKAVINDCQEVFTIRNMAVLSNSVGSKDDLNYEEAKIVEKTLGLPVIRHVKKNPAVK